MQFCIRYEGWYIYFVLTPMYTNILSTVYTVKIYKGKSLGWDSNLCIARAGVLHQQTRISHIKLDGLTKVN